MKTIDASINWEAYKRNLEHTEEKGKHGNIDDVRKPQYDTKSNGFETLIKTACLATKAKFEFNPDLEEIREKVGEKNEYKVEVIPLWPE